MRESDVCLNRIVNDNFIELLHPKESRLPSKLQRLCAPPACVGLGTKASLIARSEARNNSLTEWTPFIADNFGSVKIYLDLLQRVYATKCPAAAPALCEGAPLFFVACAGTLAATSCGVSASMNSYASLGSSMSCTPR